MQNIILALMATVLLMGNTAIAEEESLRVGMSGQYFPFTFVEQDELKGFGVDVMNAIGETLDVNVEFTTANFSGLFGLLESGRIDTVANQITITPERQDKYVFTQPYVYDGAQVVVKRGNDDIHGVEDLKGKTVAVNLGSNYEQLMRELPYADEIDIRTYESNVEQDTALGRVDAFVMDRISASQVIKDKPLPLQLAGKPFSGIRNAFPFRDNEKGRALRNRVDDALTELKEDGTLKAISEEWFGSDVTQP